MTGCLRRISAVAGREVRSAFVTPTAWIVLAISGLVASAAFFGLDFADALHLLASGHCTEFMSWPPSFDRCTKIHHLQLVSLRSSIFARF